MICNKIINFQLSGLGRQIPSCPLSLQHQRLGGCRISSCRGTGAPRVLGSPPRQRGHGGLCGGVSQPRCCRRARSRGGERLVEEQGGGAASRHRLCRALSTCVGFRASPERGAQHRLEEGREREGGKGIPPGDHRSFLGLRYKGAVGAT